MKKDIWAEFSEKLVRETERRPKGDGWMTLEELAKRFKLTYNSAQCMTKRRKHMLETFKGRALSGNGIVLPKTWYRPKL